ncbi:Xanthan lyase precursor [Roseimaritima multifibrata]|uniref:Xanthan lyase n=1 Tax=Roseimaritima multifibrata TaxID=1930274 RepID=A0A517MIV0_9BACT|nr:FAD-dependent oxidoreductase [Roseimaritima multifibrata]QDS94821.1 Xanthan lyase precursor [Roseimaritima multifibrata]
MISKTAVLAKIAFMGLFVGAFYCSSFVDAQSQATAPSVVVYGATPAGFCAAIAAAREGAAVTLVEPSHHVGGVNTGGLSFSDSNQTVRTTVMGLFDEWHTRIAADYAGRGQPLHYDVSEKNNAKWTYEPHVAARVTKAMLAEAGVDVQPNQVLTSVDLEAGRIQAILCKDRRFAADVFVDATYEGDLMAAAGVEWTIGREGRAAYSEKLAGKQYTKGTIPVSGLDSNGQLLPLLTATEGGDEEAGDRHVMVYSFRLCLTKNPENRVDFPAPETYDPKRFEAVRRYYLQVKRPHLLWDIYPLPNDKFDANNGIGKQFSMGLVGGGDDWCETPFTERSELWQKHRQYTLELYHFLTTDESVPEHLRKQMAEYGLCRDEFPETDHWSPQLYVREGRRMRGMHVLTENDVLRDPEKSDPIAVSSFPIDSHDCQRIGTAESIRNEGTIFPVRMAGRPHGYPYHVPYRSILPVKSDCENLLVPVALSATHVAFSSIRVEPTWMILGQSAGIAAALSAKQNVAVQDLPYPALQKQLLAQGQVLELPELAPLPPPAQPVGLKVSDLEGIVLDDATAEITGAWSTSRLFNPHIGSGYLHDGGDGEGDLSATFSGKVPASGNYEIRMAYSPHSSRSSRVPLEVRNGDTVKEFKVDQTVPLPVGQAFRKIGEIELRKGEPLTVTIRNQDCDGFVILDAIQFLPKL